MAPQGYGHASGPSRSSQYDDRGAGQGRQEYGGMSIGTSQQDAFGRSAPYIDGSSLFPASSSTHDYTSAGPSSSMLMHNQPQSELQTLGSNNDTIPHQQAHYTQYAQAPSHIGQSPPAYQQHQYHHQHHYQHHQHHPSEHHPMMQMPGDVVSSQALTMHHAHAQSGFYRHPEYEQSSLDAQRKSQVRPEPAEQHTPRPPNAWILYRSQKFREIQQSRDSQRRSGASEKPKSQAEISRIISQMWQNETAAIKQKFELLADEKKLAHQRMYPTYRYRPKKKAKNTKQSAAAQASDQKQTSEGHSSKRDAHGFFAAGHQEFNSSEGSTPASHFADRKVGEDSQRLGASQSVSSIHDLAGREFMPRKNTYGDRRDRGDPQDPVMYGRSVSEGISSGDSHSVSSYSSNRMHPYGDRPSSLMRQESPRPSEVFGEAQSTSGTYGGHWPESESIVGSSSNTYFDGLRSGSTTYSALGSMRLPAAPLVGGSALLPLAPLQRQPVPSQQLQHPMDNMDGSLNLTQLAGGGGATSYGNGGGGFRTNPSANHAARYGPPFGESRSELASGLAVPGGSDNLPELFDPHRRMQHP